MDRFRRLRESILRLSQVLAIVSAISILILVLIIVADVALRNLAGNGVAGNAEIAELMMPVLAYFAFPYAQYCRAHVATTVVTERLPVQIRHWVEMVGLIVFAAFIVWMLKATTDAAIYAAQLGQIRFGVLSIPTWPSKASIAIGLLALLLVLVVQIADLLREALGRTHREDLIA